MSDIDWNDLTPEQQRLRAERLGRELEAEWKFSQRPGGTRPPSNPYATRRDWGADGEVPPNPFGRPRGGRRPRSRMAEAPAQAPPDVNMPEERVVGRQMTQPRSPSPIPEAPTKHDLELGHSQSTLHRRSPGDPNTREAELGSTRFYNSPPIARDDWHEQQRRLANPPAAVAPGSPQDEEALREALRLMSRE